MLRRIALTVTLLMAVPGLMAVVVTIMNEHSSVAGVARVVVQTLLVQVASSLLVMGMLALVGVAFGQRSILWMIMGSTVGAVLLMTAWLDSVGSSPFAGVLNVIPDWFGWFLFCYYVIVIWPWMSEWRRRGRPRSLPPS